MDADFSHRPEDLPRLLEAAHGADVVIGSRNVRGGRTENWSLLRHAVSKGGSFYARMVLGLKVKDCTAGFKCFRRRALEALDLDRVQSNGFGFQVELNYLCHKAGMRLVEVPIVFPDRVAGQSKMSGNIIVEALTLVWQLRLQPASSLPIHPVAHPPFAEMAAPAHGVLAFSTPRGAKDAVGKRDFDPTTLYKDTEDERIPSALGSFKGSGQ